MTVKNYQDYRLLGGHVRFRRKATTDESFPWVDFGTMETPSPTVEGERVELEDGRTGVRQLVAAATTKVNETLPLNVNNLSLKTLAILFLSNPPIELTRNAAHKYLTLEAFKGELHQLEESGLPVHMASVIAGFYTGTRTTAVLTDIVKSTKMLSFSSNPNLSDNEVFIVSPKGLTNPLNAKVYTANGASSGSGPYTVVVDEEPEADETGVAGEAVVGTTGTIFPAADLDVRSLDDGTFVIASGSAVADNADIIVVCGVKALSGKRRLTPQDVKGQIEGEAIVTWEEENSARKLVRYIPLCVVEGSGATFQNTGSFSGVQLTLTVLSDLSKDVPAGYLDQIKGDLPAEA